MMPKIAEGDANKVWVIPSEITKALEGLGSSIHEIAGIPQQGRTARSSASTWARPSRPTLAGSERSTTSCRKANKAVEDAIAEAERSANPGRNAEGAHSADAPPTMPTAPTRPTTAAGAPPAQ